MRAAIALPLLTLALIACSPPEPESPTGPVRTAKTSEGGFGGLNKAKQKKVPAKPPLYDKAAIATFGLQPYPNTVTGTATTESVSTNDQTVLTIKFQSQDTPEQIASFYTALLNGGNATAQKIKDQTVVEGETKAGTHAAVLITTVDGKLQTSVNVTKKNPH